MKRKKVVIVLAIFSLLFLTVQFFFIPKTYVNSRIVSALQTPKVLFGGVFNRHNIIENLQDLTLENQALQAQISELKLRPEIVKEDRVTYLISKVYSNYPFNDADLVLLHAGKNDGLKEGMVATVKPGIFFGEVVRVDDKISEVKTLFDKSVEIPVKIGPNMIDGLLIGGSSVKVTLISKNQPIASDQGIYLADRKYPFGLSVGKVGSIASTDQDLFEEASVVLPYEKSQIKELFIRL